MEDRKEKAALNDELLDKIAGGGDTLYEKHFCRTCCRERVFVSYGGGDRFFCTVCGYPLGN